MKNVAKIGDKFVLKSRVPGFQDLVVVFIGMQESGFAEFPAFALYNLMSNLPGHPKDSTIGRDVLDANGYVLPDNAPKT